MSVWCVEVELPEPCCEVYKDRDLIEEFPLRSLFLSSSFFLPAERSPAERRGAIAIRSIELS